MRGIQRLGRASAEQRTLVPFRERMTFGYFRALKLGNASQVAPSDKLSVVLVPVFAVVFLGEKLAPHNWLGVALIGGGAILVAKVPP
ncbi:MAG: EamA family transporter [Kaiparowitsia implicata GSE-PSE-MK54-09C]|jgi:uncharacterized membrane protein|nr:EamA family transporter [Kaiparowitsia implicata GSE-PSE-MK54-09C]